MYCDGSNPKARYLRTEWSTDMGRAQVFAKDSQAVVVPDKMQLADFVRAAVVRTEFQEFQVYAPRIVPLKGS